MTSPIAPDNFAVQTEHGGWLLADNGTGRYHGIGKWPQMFGNEMVCRSLIEDYKAGAKRNDKAAQKCRIVKYEAVLTEVKFK